MMVGGWPAAAVAVTFFLYAAAPVDALPSRSSPHEREKAAVARVGECAQAYDLGVVGEPDVAKNGAGLWAGDPLGELIERAVASPAGPPRDASGLLANAAEASVELAQCIFGPDVDDYPRKGGVAFVVVWNDDPDQTAVEVTRRGMEQLVAAKLSPSEVVQSWLSGSERYMRLTSLR